MGRVRSTEQASTDCRYFSAQLVHALQDADADEQLIDRAEEIQSEVQDL